MGNLIYIMGKSSSGKDTIYKELKNKININSYVSYTTRPMRYGEKEGREYHYLTKEQFDNLKSQDKVMESRTYNVINENGDSDVWTYATINDNQWDKEGDFISIGTLESYKNILEYLKKHAHKNLNIIPVYIKIDEEERRKRAIKREELNQNKNYAEMERRLKADNIDFSDEKLKQVGIGQKQTFENYNLEKCTQEILEYIRKEE